MNHKIIFNKNTSSYAEGDNNTDYMYIQCVGTHLVELFKVRGYVYLNQIYEFFGIKWNPNDENQCWTKEEGYLFYNVRNIDEGFEIIFES